MRNQKPRCKRQDVRLNRELHDRRIEHLTIRRLAQAGKAILLAEQHVDLAVRCADEIHVLVLGTLERSVTVDAADDEDHRLHLVELIMGGSPEPALHA